MRRGHGSGRAWRRQTLSILFYGLALPVATIVLACLPRPWRWLALVPMALYARLTWSIATYCRRRNRDWGLCFMYAALEVMCKVAGAIGVIQFAVGNLRRAPVALIEYKTVSSSGAPNGAVSPGGGVYRVVDALASAVAFPVRALARVSDAVRRFMRLVRLRAAVSGHVPATTQFDGPVRAQRGSRVFLGEYCRLGRDTFFETGPDAGINIGPHVTINSGCVIVAHAGITIGRDCLIGEYVSIRDANHGIATSRPMRVQPHDAAAIRIEDDVWIGRGSVILKGVTVGRGAVIGANSVVTKDVAPMWIVAGAPAREIRCRMAGEKPVEFIGDGKRVSGA
jgi:acetyltransferase-like isoleucine patch superfamily enzyme